MNTVYSIVNPISNKVVYVGKTKNFKLRQGQHIKNTHNKRLRKEIESILKFDKLPIFNVLEVCDNNSFSETEIQWIRHFSEMGFDLCNIRGIKGVKLSATLVYLPIDKYLILKSISVSKRISLTKLISNEVDNLISREAK